ncbi:hypothetical protein D9M71_485780 [compost metagenome]
MQGGQRLAEFEASDRAFELRIVVREGGAQQPRLFVEPAGRLGIVLIQQACQFMADLRQLDGVHRYALSNGGAAEKLLQRGE